MESKATNILNDIMQKLSAITEVETKEVENVICHVLGILTAHVVFLVAVDNSFRQAVQTDNELHLTNWHGITSTDRVHASEQANAHGSGERL